MFNYRQSVFAFVLAGCLAILAGCGGDQSSTMAAPAAVAAIAGNKQVSLTWSADSGATSYDVKRATISGGPYTQIASVTSPSYTDSAVTNGVTYYYVITAVGSWDQSAVIT
jgi:cellulose 1,4-beta-cellobiosidase